MMLPLSVSGQQSIAGRRVASGEVTLLSQRAADGKLAGYHSHPAPRKEAAAIAEATGQVFPVYPQAAPDVHVRLLDTIADELDLLGKDSFAIAHQEMALSLARSQGERTRTSNQLRIFAGVLRRDDVFGVRIDTAFPDRQPLPRPDLRQFLAALGPVTVFGASNFPLAFSTAGGDTASVLAASCPVVMKAHPGHMAAAELAAQAIVRTVVASGLPAGVFNMIFGTDIGADLVRHPAIQAVGFTGSLHGGKTLWQPTQRRLQPIPVFAEISAINPLIILPQAATTRVETLANELVPSSTLGCGQFYTKPGSIFVLRGKGMSHFTQALGATVDLTPAQIILNALALAHYEEGVSTLEVHPHIRRLARSDESATGRAQVRLYQAPASSLLAQDPSLQQEVFDLPAVLVKVADEAELQSILRVIPGQLMVTVHAELDDGLLARCLLSALTERAGHILFDGYPTGVEICDTMVYGGPWLATVDVRGTSVGMQSADHFLRPVYLQSMPAALLPPAVQDDNPLNLLRLINGQWTREAISPSADQRA